MPYEKKLRRRRRSPVSSIGAAITRPLRTLLRRAPAGVPEAAACAALLAAGIWIIRSSLPQSRVAGIVVCCLGAGGLVWQAWKAYARAEAAASTRESQRSRSRRKSERRDRDQREQEMRRAQAFIDSTAHERARTLDEVRRQSATEQAAADEQHRRSREEAIAAEAQRLLALDGADLRQAAIEAFESRGFTVTSGDDEAGCDLLLGGPAGDLSIVARLVPRSRTADVVDVRALEALRQDMQASAEILIATAGFTPEAIRQASGLPATLVEAHLLAQWRFTPAPEESAAVTRKRRISATSASSTP